MGFLDALLRGATVVISQVWQGTRAVVRDLLREIAFTEDLSGHDDNITLVCVGIELEHVHDAALSRRLFEIFGDALPKRRLLLDTRLLQFLNKGLGVVVLHAYHDLRCGRQGSNLRKHKATRPST